MRIIIIFLLTIILFINCSDDKNPANVCTTNDPIEEIPWVAELKESMTNCSCEISIIKGTYEAQTVIFIGLTDALCDGIDTPTLYNCEGKEVRSFTGSDADQKELSEKVTRDSVLYRCKS